MSESVSCFKENELISNIFNQTSYHGLLIIDKNLNDETKDCSETSTNFSPVSSSNMNEELPELLQTINLFKEIQISNRFVEELSKNKRTAESKEKLNNLSKSTSVASIYSPNLLPKNNFLKLTSSLKFNWKNKINTFKESRKRKIISKINFMLNSKINNFDLKINDEFDKKQNNFTENKSKFFLYLAKFNKNFINKNKNIKECKNPMVINHNFSNSLSYFNYNNEKIVNNLNQLNCKSNHCINNLDIGQFNFVDKFMNTNNFIQNKWNINRQYYV